MKNRKVKTLLNGTPSLKGRGGPTDDLNLRALSTGEAVLPADSVQAIGGPRAIKALIDATHTPVRSGPGGSANGFWTPLELQGDIERRNRQAESDFNNRRQQQAASQAQTQSDQLAQQSGALSLDRARMENQDFQTRIGQDQQRRQRNQNALGMAYRANGEAYVRPLAQLVNEMAGGGTVWSGGFEPFPDGGRGTGNPAVWSAIGSHPNPTLQPITGFGQPTASWVMNSQSPGRFPRDFAIESPPVLSRTEELWANNLPKKSSKDSISADDYYNLSEEERRKYRMSHGARMAHGGMVKDEDWEEYLAGLSPREREKALSAGFRMADGGMVGLAQRAKRRGLGMAGGGSISFRKKSSSWDDYEEYLAGLDPYQRQLARGRASMGWNGNPTGPRPLTSGTPPIPQVKGMAGGGYVGSPYTPETRPNLFGKPAEYASYEDYQAALFAGLTPAQRVTSQHDQQVAQQADAATAAAMAQRNAAYDSAAATGRFDNLTPAQQQWARENIGWVNAHTQPPGAGNAVELQARDNSIANDRAMEAARLMGSEAVSAEQIRQRNAQYEKLTGKPFVAPPPDPAAQAVEDANLARVTQQNTAGSALEAQNRARLTPQQLLEQQAQGRYLNPTAPQPMPTAPTLPPAGSPLASRPMARPAGPPAQVMRPTAGQGPAALPAQQFDHPRPQIPGRAYNPGY